MKGILKNCLGNLCKRGETGRICVGRWQEVAKLVDLRCVRDKKKSVDRGLKGALVRAGGRRIRKAV